MSFTRQKKRPSRALKIAAYSTGIVLGMSTLAFAVMQSVGQDVPDKNGCYQQVPIGQHIHVLLDASQPRFTAPQERSIYRFMLQIYKDLRFGDRVSVNSTEGNHIASVAKSQFHACGQANDPIELEDLNVPETNSEYLVKQKERHYQRRLLPKLERLLAKDLPDERLALSSPILEQIADISRQKSFKAGDKLVVISDLIQNSDTSQFCTVKNGMPHFSAFQNWEPYQTRLKPKSLKNIKVDVLMLQRAEYGKYCSGESEVRAFWSDFFKANGAEANFIRLRMRG